MGQRPRRHQAPTEGDGDDGPSSGLLVRLRGRRAAPGHDELRQLLPAAGGEADDRPNPRRKLEEDRERLAPVRRRDVEERKGSEDKKHTRTTELIFSGSAALAVAIQ